MATLGLDIVLGAVGIVVVEVGAEADVDWRLEEVEEDELLKIFETMLDRFFSDGVLDMQHYCPHLSTLYRSPKSKYFFRFVDISVIMICSRHAHDVNNLSTSTSSLHLCIGADSAFWLSPIVVIVRVSFFHLRSSTNCCSAQLCRLRA